tara:strand:- start:1165 stop:1800 length:636 start_codon:yes stop_codon:yes gene_type:complete
MKKLFENWNNFLLNESSLSRIHQHITNHDAAILTAFRDDPANISMCAGANAEQNPDNKLRNRDLKAALLSLGYGVTAVDGSFIENYSDLENRVEVREDSLFVVNLNDDNAFTTHIDNLGQKYCQDSVLIIPQGGKGAYLLGTNNTDFPGFGNEDVVGDFFGGQEAEFLSRVGGRPFVFKEEKNKYKLDVYEDHSRNARMSIKAIAKRILKN